eukprot:Awhi_evm1s331
MTFPTAAEGFKYLTIPPPTPIEIYVLLGIYCTVTIFCMTINAIFVPNLTIKCWEAFKTYRENLDKRTRKVFVVALLYLLMNVFTIAFGYFDAFFGTALNQVCLDDPLKCKTANSQQNIGKVLVQFFGSSIGFLYILRIYAFVENMISMKPTKLETRIYFWYSIASVFAYLLLFLLEVFKVTPQYSVPVTQIYQLVENFIYQGLLTLVLFRVIKVNSQFAGHPMLLLVKDSTILLFIIGFFRIVIQAVLVYYGTTAEPTILGVYRVVMCGILQIITDVLMTIFMNVVTIRAGQYTSGHKTDRTSETTKNSSVNSKKTKFSKAGSSDVALDADIGFNETSIIEICA